MTHALTQFTLQTDSDAETRAFGERLGRLLGPNDVVCLRGELGAGKTTLAQGIAAGLGVEEPVSSPTFALVQEYAGRLPVFHLDVFRLASLDELIDLGFPELWRAGAVLLLEWPERIATALPPDRLEITIEPVAASPGSDVAPRRLTVTAFGERSGGHVKALIRTGGGPLPPAPSPKRRGGATPITRANEASPPPPRFGEGAGGSG